MASEKHAAIGRLLHRGHHSRRRLPPYPIIGPLKQLQNDSRISFPLWLTGSVLVLAIVLGGGATQGLLSDAALELSSLPLLGMSIAALCAKRLPQSAWPPLAILVAIVVLIVAQLIPLPPALWTRLPARAEFATTYLEAGMGLPWLPLSLDSDATWRSGLALLPGISIFLAVLQLRTRDRRSLSALLVALAFASVLLGLAQLAQGPESGLRPYLPFTTTDAAVGFFANRNQYSALLYSAMPFTVAVGTRVWLKRQQSKSTFVIVLCILIYATLILGLTTALSRAGLILGFLAGVGSLAIWKGNETPVFRMRGAGIVVLLALVVAFAAQLFLVAALEKREELSDVGRAEMNRTTLRAAQDFFPVGSGFGTFIAVYEMYERPEAVSTSYANHAHDDWAEVWLEGGVPAGLIAAAFIIWFLAKFKSAWLGRRNEEELDIHLARASWIVIGLLLIHSAVDYPLRTGTDLAVLAFACALLVPTIREPEPLAAPGRPR